MFPDAPAEWLGGSVTSGAATALSDLDIVVLTRHGPIHRRSLHFEGRPVEYFAHTDARHRLSARCGSRLELADTAPKTRVTLSRQTRLRSDPSSGPHEWRPPCISRPDQRSST